MTRLGQEIREFMLGLMADTHTALPATIEEFDEEDMRASVQLLRRDEAGEARIIVEAPVMTIRAGGIAIVPPYQRGDVVLLIFAESDLEGPLFDGDPRDPEFERRHSLDDAIVIGGLVADNQSIDVGGDASNFRIGDEDGTGYAEITPDGTVRLFFDTIELGSGTLEALVNQTGADLFNGHTHPGDSGGTTGTPIQQMGSAEVTSETEAS